MGKQSRRRRTPAATPRPAAVDSSAMPWLFVGQTIDFTDGKLPPSVCCGLHGDDKLLVFKGTGPTDVAAGGSMWAPLRSAVGGIRVAPESTELDRFNYLSSAEGLRELALGGLDPHTIRMPWVDAETATLLPAQKCHANSLKCASSRGGKPVLTYSLHPATCGCCAQFEAHSVHQPANSTKLVDVTRDVYECSSHKVVLPDPVLATGDLENFATLCKSGVFADIGMPPGIRAFNITPGKPDRLFCNPVVLLDVSAQAQALGLQCQWTRAAAVHVLKTLGISARGQLMSPADVAVAKTKIAASKLAECTMCKRVDFMVTTAPAKCGYCHAAA